MPIRITMDLKQFKHDLDGRFQTANATSMMQEAFEDDVRGEFLAIQEKAKELAPNEHIRNNIEMEISRNDSQGMLQFKGDLFVDLDEVPDARAFEDGSGIHATKGAQRTYSIDAINAPNLVFWWKNQKKWFKGPHVNHPGVAPVKYLRGAVNRFYGSIQGIAHRGAVKFTHKFFRSSNDFD